MKSVIIGLYIVAVAFKTQNKHHLTSLKRTSPDVIKEPNDKLKISTSVFSSSLELNCKHNVDFTSSEESKMDTMEMQQSTLNYKRSRI